MAKKVVRIHFMDDSVKAFAIDEHSTLEDLRATVVDKIGLVEDSCFALYERKGTQERCLESEEVPCTIMDDWVRDSRKRSDKDPPPKFVFKKKIFLRNDERELTDVVAKHLLFIQARRAVIDSDYPCSVDECVKLGGLAVQIVYGDHNAATHVTGFLQNNLHEFVPKALMSSKKAAEWESQLYAAHRGFSGMDENDAKTKFLEVVKEWPYYGTSFFPGCKPVGNKKLTSKVVIGVNCEGIILVRPKDKELISAHPYTEVCAWASSGQSFSFEFGAQNNPTKYTFETHQGGNITSIIQSYVDILVQLLKKDSDGELLL